MPTATLSMPRRFTGGIAPMRFPFGSDDLVSQRLPKNKEYSEELEDEYLLALAEERLRNDNGKFYSFEDILAEDGLTIDDVDDWEDVEIE